MQTNLLRERNYAQSNQAIGRSDLDILAGSITLPRHQASKTVGRFGPATLIVLNATGMQSGPDG